ncbi:hypothetical protein MPTK1_1g10360 [Marchantia polymorpha subsp. ruderalis]|uniref:Uncharacterized protein n=2 Tax=Marchantia polymorpha TaxID=3197 RepID=A0AAF6ANM2_MARPO|nr:hypothetical protein MARPO_0014s0190 [Marchantia polymorpha]BBM98042.1 hypothetical protein Mp_1g10360 [Marchantia polymorpha subsp. ruderalis]|eukprot:PTQ45683.1 hypothetical protein MARPO_0014s0190 [Marchantia polymorpha]
MDDLNRVVASKIVCFSQGGTRFLSPRFEKQYRLNVPPGTSGMNRQTSNPRTILLPAPLLFFQVWISSQSGPYDNEYTRRYRP